MKSVFAATIMTLLAMNSFAAAEAPLKFAFEGCWTGTAELVRYQNGIVRENASCKEFVVKIRQVATETFAYQAGCFQSANPESNLNSAFKRMGDTALKNGQLVYRFFNFDAETGFETRIRGIADDRLDYTYVRSNDDLTGITLTSLPLQRTVNCPL